MNISTQALAKALSKVSSSVSSNVILPILEYVKIHNETITGTNLNQTIVTKLPGVTETLLLPFAELKSILATAPDVITVSVKKGVTFIQSGKSTYNLGVLPSPDLFPNLPEMSASHPIKVTADFFFALSMAAKSTSPNSEKIDSMWHNVVVHPQKEKINIFSSHNGTGFFFSQPTKSSVEARLYVLPSFTKAVASFQDADLYFDSNNIMVDDSTTQVYQKLSEGTYPDYTKLIKEFQPNIVVNTADLKREVDKMFIYGTIPVINFTVSDNIIEMKYVDSGTERVCETSVDCETKDAEDNFWVNGDLLRRCLTQTNSGVLNIYVKPIEKAIAILPMDEPDTTILIYKVQPL